MPESETAQALAALNATVIALNTTTSNGFDALTERLDTQNGRLRRVENKATEIVATMVTTKVCEKIRNRIATTSAEGWKRFVIPVASTVSAVALAKLIWG